MIVLSLVQVILSKLYVAVRQECHIPQPCGPTSNSLQANTCLVQMLFISKVPMVVAT